MSNTAHVRSRCHLTGRCDCLKNVRLRGSPSMPPGAFNSCSSELVQRIDELKEKRDEISKMVQAEEEEKESIQRDLTILSRRLAEIDESLALKYQYTNDYDKTIQEAENAYSIIMESSQSLLHVLKLEKTELLNKA